jgi:hypothetical protein
MCDKRNANGKAVGGVDNTIITENTPCLLFGTRWILGL